MAEYSGVFTAIQEILIISFPIACALSLSGKVLNMILGMFIGGKIEI